MSRKNPPSRATIGPSLRALKEGTVRIGAGDFAYRVPVDADDALAPLAEQLNAMAARLQERFARSEREIQAAQEQQTATSEILRVISSSPTDVQPVFDTIAQSAMRLCDGAFSVVVRYYGDLMHLAAHAYGPAEWVKLIQQKLPMPEDVMQVLHQYHAAMGALVLEHDGTLERFTGDGMMVFFNDPVPVPDPAARAIRMAVAMRDRVRSLRAAWMKQGHDLDVGVGIAQGYATIGAIGFEGRWDYGAIGTVTNLAFRLCSEAKGGQILVSSRVASAAEDLVEVEEVGALPLRGLLKPVPTFNVVSWRPADRSG